jgi:transcriptional regulator with XRE-family HTH domain
MTGYRTRDVTGQHPVITRLVQARKDAHLSQAALADRLGITQTALSYWESGRREPAFVDVARWAAALGLVLFAAEPAIPEGPLPELAAGGLA